MLQETKIPCSQFHSCLQFSKITVGISGVNSQTRPIWHVQPGYIQFTKPDFFRRFAESRDSFHCDMIVLGSSHEWTEE
jgi:hypothetical protein